MIISQIKRKLSHSMTLKSIKSLRRGWILIKCGRKPCRVSGSIVVYQDHTLSYIRIRQRINFISLKELIYKLKLLDLRVFLLVDINLFEIQN